MTMMMRIQSAALTSSIAREQRERRAATLPSGTPRPTTKLVATQPHELRDPREHERRRVEPLKPGSTRRSGFTAQSVSATTAWPSGLRNGARSHCITKRSRNA